MIYQYKCVDVQCSERNKVKEISMSLNEAGNPQYCKVCGNELQKIYGLSGHSTFSDGYKG